MSSGSAISYTYDKNGNQLTKGGTTNTYNQFNQLVSTTKSGVTTTYTYNPDGTRHSKTVGTNPTTYYLWQNGNIIAEMTLAGNPTAVYTYGINLITSTAGSTTSYYLYNAHGDVTGLADTNGTVVKYYRYDAFGNEINANPSDTNPFRYSGQYFDKETGDYYLQARYYDPANGRFTQQDDWGYANANDPLSLNLYTYCSNDSVNMWDFNGHDDYHGGDADPSYWADPDNVWAYAQDHPYCNPIDTWIAPVNDNYVDIPVPGVSPAKQSSKSETSSNSSSEKTSSTSSSEKTSSTAVDKNKSNSKESIGFVTNEPMGIVIYRYTAEETKQLAHLMNNEWVINGMWLSGAPCISTPYAWFIWIEAGSYNQQAIFVQKVADAGLRLEIRQVPVYMHPSTPPVLIYTTW